MMKVLCFLLSAMLTVQLAFGSECQFQCRSSIKCIPLNWLCDGDNDCGGNEDEHPSICSVNGDWSQIHTPNESPVFPTDNSLDITDGRLTVAEGQSVTLICEVNGGTPLVSSTVITCDVRDSSVRAFWSNDGQQVKAHLTIKHGMDQKVCTCSAEHVSNQYDKETSLTLNVLHVARIDSLTVNETVTDEDFEVSEGESAQLRCSAYGNPTPYLHLYKSYSDGRTTRMLDDTVNTSLSSTIDHATCETSGTYVCAANNSLSTETSERRVDIKVRCEPQPCSERYSDREFSITPGNEAEVILCVFAYPEPRHDIRVRPAKGSDFDKNLYSTHFTYMDSVRTKGYVHISLSASVTKQGNYTVLLYQQTWHSIGFSLVFFHTRSESEPFGAVVIALVVGIIVVVVAAIVAVVIVWRKGRMGSRDPQTLGKNNDGKLTKEEGVLAMKKYSTNRTAVASEYVDVPASKPGSQAELQEETTYTHMEDYHGDEPRQNCSSNVYSVADDTDVYGNAAVLYTTSTETTSQCLNTDQEKTQKGTSVKPNTRDCDQRKLKPKKEGPKVSECPAAQEQTAEDGSTYEEVVSGRMLDLVEQHNDTKDYANVAFSKAGTKGQPKRKQRSHQIEGGALGSAKGHK